jgi:hypothetical protein
MRLIAIVLVALLPGIAFAEENCRVLVRTVTRFRGNVRSVESIVTRKGPVVPCDFDPRYAVTIAVESAPPDDMAVRAGQTHVFGIHSPSRTFGADSAVGKTLDLEVQWSSCDATFRRFEALRTIGRERWIEDYDGSVEVGHSYRAAVQREEEHVRLARPLIAPYHHGIRGDFENEDAFPELRNADGTRTIVFEVLSKEIIHRGNRQWTTLYAMRIIEVLPD